jgi:hypothetical protein
VTARIIATGGRSQEQCERVAQNRRARSGRWSRVFSRWSIAQFYGLPGQIGSIERAIVLLGLNAVKNIAVAASLGQLFRGVKLCDGFTAKDLWKTLRRGSR